MNTKIWVEKYRPSNLEQLVQESNIKKIIDNVLITGAMPHLLLYGPPGTGKTTTALAICKQFFGNKGSNILENKRIYSERVLELNASDERGIQYVREHIKLFSESAICKRPNMPDFKLVILDECDAMTNDSQCALRMIMEKYSTNTRFILLCNYVSKIISPLVSRTVKHKYKNINYVEMTKAINNIAKNENIEVSAEFIERLRTITKGDLRKSIILLEQCATFYNDISIKTLDKCANIIPEDYFMQIISKLENKQTTKLELYNTVINFINESYLITLLVEKIYDYFIDADISEIKKAYIIKTLTKVDASLNNNSDEKLTLVYLFSEIHHIL